MKITMSAGKGNEHVLEHDLNFAEERYESNHKVVCFVSLATRPRHYQARVNNEGMRVMLTRQS